MKYISVEEFLEQPKEVQEVFLNWWKPNIGDLFVWNTEEDIHDMHKVSCCTSVNMVNLTLKNKGIKEGERIPLLVEGQLRKFIEDKTNEKLVFDYYTTSGYRIVLYKNNIRHTEIVANEYDNLGKSLIQAYWKVAIQIAKEC